jgi:nucleotide sugar dehydrogenase
VGDTRGRFAPRLAELSGLALGDELLVAFSPERLYSGSALRNLAMYPKLVGGIDAGAGRRAAAFYASVLDAEVVLMSSAEAAEFAKLADTTYRDVNIGLANEFARYADRIGVDVTEVIAAANSQPYSHIHQPGIGVGGHCIPVYPRFLLAREPAMEIVAASRRVNDAQVGLVVDRLGAALGGLDGVGVLVLGLTYRAGVRELAYSRAIPLIDGLRAAGARVLAHDPLLASDEVARLGAEPWAWGATTAGVAAVVTQTEDPLFRSLDAAWLPDLRIVVDGRNSLAGLALPADVDLVGIGTGSPVSSGSNEAAREPA